MLEFELIVKNYSVVIYLIRTFELSDAQVHVVIASLHGEAEVLFREGTVLLLKLQQLESARKLEEENTRKGHFLVSFLVLCQDTIFLLPHFENNKSFI